MSNEIKVFESKEFGKVRTVIVDNEPWFVGKDVAKILGYSNPQKAIRDHVDDEDRTVNESFTVNGTSPIIINESGLYGLILSSKLSNARKFKHWVTSEVLPAIRKTGSYSISQSNNKPDSYMIEDPVERAKRWIEEYEEKKALKIKIEQDKPLVDFANHVSNTEGLIDVEMLAKIARDNNIKVGRNKMFEWLRDNGYLISKGLHRNEPYQRYIEQGLFVVKECSFYKGLEKCLFIKTFVTGKGQIYFINELRKNFTDIKTKQDKEIELYGKGK